MITLSQKKTYEFIKDFIADHQHSPTMAEIAHGIGIKSRGVVHRYVAALAEEGLITITPGHRRNIVLRMVPQTSSLMIKGRIAAGKPIEAVADNEALDIIGVFLGPNRYALKVKGDSMIEEGILDGDIVVCEYTEVAQEGKIVVALVDEQEATLKRIKYNNDNTVTLIPANVKLKPMSYPRSRIHIQGIYIGLLRFDGA